MACAEQFRKGGSKGNTRWQNFYLLTDPCILGTLLAKVRRRGLQNWPSLFCLEGCKKERSPPRSTERASQCWCRCAARWSEVPPGGSFGLSCLWRQRSRTEWWACSSLQNETDQLQPRFEIVLLKARTKMRGSSTKPSKVLLGTNVGDISTIFLKDIKS